MTTNDWLRNPPTVVGIDRIGESVRGRGREGEGRERGRRGEGRGGEGRERGGRGEGEGRG